MRQYELTYIIASDVDEQEYNETLAQVQKWIEEVGGSVVGTDQWGRRKLAYQIREFTEGYYITLRTDMEPHTTAELERNLQLSERVIRHILLRADE
ncbi:MAG: 30S ribosomal protein S6 [Anaerolineae bacterium]